MLSQDYDSRRQVGFRGLRQLPWLRRVFSGPPQVIIVWALVGVVGPNMLAGSALFLGTTALIFALFAMSTNILLGWTGITSFGQAAFFGAGAYSVGIAVPMGFPPVVAVGIGAIVAGGLALILSVMATRVTGVAFAMLTLMFGQILTLLLYRIPLLGGESGLPGISRGEIFGASLFSDITFWWYAIVLTGILAVLISYLRGSTLGVSLNAVRDNPVRAAALGINVKATRVIAFVIAGLTAGVAGGLFAQLQGIASPDVTAWLLSGVVLVMCLIGGIYTYWGPAIGAVIYTVANWALTSSTNAPQLYFGLVLLVIVLVLPQGLLGLMSVFTTRRRIRTKEMS